jgi:uncharacterized RDD family membrane protein YckC/peroxiredoxin
MSQNQQPIRCPKCGAELPPQLNASLCPKCLLQVGLGTQPQTGPEDTVVLPQSAALKGIPQPGEDYGHYRLIRLLGQGGMGVVFEADDLETGRRVALKILSQALDSPEARKRFLREGQIAASINHPNSVYVFGTEEIAGTPVIAMELVAGGTLRDRVVASGPLSATEAVDVILQIIAGLEAAQQAGVLHRDIKPSNCFIDSDGTIKIGDFGLSITTTVRPESNLTGSGSLFGTPAFSSPEQLRGEELTVRSDIYSVGVTLYYLLTGRMPFEALNIVQLLVTVLEKKPESPAGLRAGIPKGLARAVLHCLNKDSSERFASYAALRRALLPYASSSPSPATLPLRFVAWLIDHLGLSLVNWAVFFMVFGSFTAMMSPDHGGTRLLTYFISFGMVILYFGLMEGIRGASLGKMLCRLRVVDLDGNTPDVKKAFLRVLIFSGFSSLPTLALTYFSSDWLTQHPPNPKMSFAWLIPTVIQLLIFYPCRRRNGFAGLHDLWSRTRVLAQSDQPVRPGMPPELELPPVAGETARIGPYHVLAELGQSDDAAVLLGYDSRLLRKVWLRRVSAAAPAVDAALRHLGRPGRLRWLNAKRSDDDSWDAYEAPAGQPLLGLISVRQDWGKIRFWLLDLAEELKTGVKDGSMPRVLSLDRVWITADGHAKLLDFPAPETNSSNKTETPQLSNPQAFLRQVALSALEGRPLNVEQAHVSTLELPLPLYARSFFQRIESEPNARQVWERLKPLTGKVAAITRRRRWAMLVIALCFPVFVVLTQMVTGVLLRNSNSMEFAVLKNALTQVKPLETKGTNSVNQSSANEKDRQLEIYIAGRFRPLITNSVEWNGYTAQVSIQPAQRKLAEKIVQAYPKTTPAEFAEAKTTVESQFHIPPPRAQTSQAAFAIPFMLPMIIYASTLLFVIIPCFVAAILFRGGMAMRGLGVAVVGRNGRPSRMRTVWRNFIAWLPFLLSPMLLKAMKNIIGAEWALTATTIILASITVISLALRRSLQDHLAQTWLVPDGAMPEIDPGLAGKRQTHIPWLPIVAGVGGLILMILLVQFSRGAIHSQKDSTTTSRGNNSAANQLTSPPCVALLPDGSPATNAWVWVGTEKDPSRGTPALDSFRPGDFYPHGMQKYLADAAGKFNLPAAPEDMLVVVTHPSGVLVSTAGKMRKDTRVRLQPFSQVEGVLLSEGKPKPGAQIIISLFQYQSRLRISYSGVSGADGKFHFTNLVAGEYRLYRVFMPRRRIDRGFTSYPSHQKIISVKLGETAKIQWGGDGRAVIGQAAPENPAVAVDWLNDSQSLELVRPSAATSVTKFVRDSWGLGTSAAERWKEARNARSYHLEFEEDGSFRAEDVSPGNYELRIKVTKPAPGPDPYLHEGELLGSLVQSVTIPEGKESYDLGQRIVPVKGETGGAVALPLNASLTTLEGQTLQLASLRGKYVVLVFWASWSEPSKNTLAALQKVRADFPAEPGVQFMATSVDDDAESLRRTAASAGEGFTWARLSTAERASVTEAFDITALPAVLLLGPDGRIYARDLSVERLTTTLRRVLPHR